MFKLLDKWPQVAAFSAAMLLVFAVMYEWAFFWEYDPSWIPLLSIRDYVILSIQWLPKSLALLSLASAVLWYGYVVHDVPTRITTIRSSVLLVAMTIAFALFLLFFPKLAISIAFYSFVEDSGGPKFLIVTGGSFALFVIYMIFVVEPIRTPPKKLDLSSFVIVAVIPNLLVFFQHGFSAAVTVQKENIFPVQFEKIKSESLGIVKILERGVLVRDYATGRTMFLPWSEVGSFKGK